MGKLDISTSWDGKAADPYLFEQLRRDLEREVGPVERDSAEAAGPKGAKGAELGMIGSLAVAIISSHALAALIGVLRSHLERGREYEMEISGPGGSIKLKGADVRRLMDEEFLEVLQRILGKA